MRRQHAPRFGQQRAPVRQMFDDFERRDQIEGLNSRNGSAVAEACRKRKLGADNASRAYAIASGDDIDTDDEIALCGRARPRRIRCRIRHRARVRRMRSVPRTRSARYARPTDRHSPAPGMTRSPVNSVTARAAPAPIFGVHLHAAGEMKLSVDRPVGSFHLQDDRVVDPVAHGVVLQRAIGDRGREGESDA